MNPMTDHELERELTTLTTWDGPTPELWRAAERSAARKPARPLGVRIRRLLPIGGIAALLMIVAYSSLTWTVRTARLRGIGQSSHISDQTDQDRLRVDSDWGLQSLDKSFMGSGDWTWRNSAGEGNELRDRLGVGRTPAQFISPSDSGGQPDSPKRIVVEQKTSDPGVDSARQVVRKATLELGVTDVRAAFARASLLVSEARGEFVQESAVTGTEPNITANLTLRIAADRLSAALNDLRQLGVVRNEVAGGEDVTGQVVDLEARLRNERRIEQELLDLLEKRKDAPLKDVLDVRNSLSTVRQSIEQMIAQRDRLAHLVSLATVLLIIRPVDAPPPPKPTLGGYLWDSFARAADRGAKFLADSAAGLLAVLIGGALWWLILTIVIIAVRRAYRRSSRAT